MARITVEDCLDHVDNRFALVMLASRRARSLRNYNTEALVDKEDDKPTVVALREIALGLISHEMLDQHDASMAEEEEIRLDFAMDSEAAAPQVGEDGPTG
ncbi:MAG TPA: DNA-directed RNA polymerase subunit omega [Gammaproteobacteria bacterium]|nr:DNA-directed RNA polymerase subunit omega [Gammaproteobacteria bacterium]|tara:strand:+ start:951 stop:1250 length:300 start_codon:yes stop_codon:yes gene_type:complete